MQLNIYKKKQQILKYFNIIYCFLMMILIILQYYRTYIVMKVRLCLVVLLICIKVFNFEKFRRKFIGMLPTNWYSQIFVICCRNVYVFFKILNVANILCFQMLGIERFILIVIMLWLTWLIFVFNYYYKMPKIYFY